MHCHNTLYIAS